VARARALLQRRRVGGGWGRRAGEAPRGRSGYASADAQSLPEAFILQTEFFQKLAAQTTEQTKEFFDLSTRATQHVFEQVQVAAAKAMKPVA
jgi:hypothetical protein